MEPHLEERLTRLEEKIDSIYRVAQKTRQVQKRGNTVRMLYWVFIILLGFGAFYFITPIIGQLKDVYGIGGQQGNNFDRFMNQLNNK